MMSRLQRVQDLGLAIVAMPFVLAWFGAMALHQAVGGMLRKIGGDD